MKRIEKFKSFFYKYKKLFWLILFIIFIFSYGYHIVYQQDIYIDLNKNEFFNIMSSSLNYSNITVISDGYLNNWGWNNKTSKNPDIFVDNNNIIHVVWDDITPGIWGGGVDVREIMYANCINGTWSNATVISDGYQGEWGWNTSSSYEPSIIVDGSNNIHVVWSDSTPGIWGGGADSEIMYVNCTNGKWSNATVISDGYQGEWGCNTGYSLNPDITVDDSYNLHVVWFDSTPGIWGGGVDETEIMYVNCTNGKWSNATVISDGYNGEWCWNDGDSVNPDITVDDSNNLHVVWYDDTNGKWGDDYEIMYVNCTNGKWSNITVISDGYQGEWGWNTGDSLNPDITVDDSNNLHVVWDDSTPGIWGSGTDDYEIMYVNYSNGAWSNITVISDGYQGEWGWNDGYSFNPVIAVDDFDVLHVVWSDSTSGIWGDDTEIIYVTINNPSNLPTPTPSDNNNGNPFFPNIHIFYVIVIVLSVIGVTIPSLYVIKSKVKLNSIKKQNFSKYNSKYFDKSKLIKIFNNHNSYQKYSNTSDILITILSKDFFNKVESLKWDNIDKMGFINEMLSIKPKKRNQTIDEMIKFSKFPKSDENHYKEGN